MAKVSVRNVVRQYGTFKALDDITFDVEDGEFLTLLGPSGCGKSTTLAALAGLDRPTSGRITIGDRLVFDGAAGTFVDAQYRNLGLMFQSYALWPHMTVRKNLDFPLELRRIRGAAADRRIMETLELVNMAEYAGRYPGELSGGQQQRVALARTLVYGPEILLLDEPLSNLDAKLRERARVWLGELQKRTGVTTVYVTHDQSEALALSDSVIVMDRGRIAQKGSPKAIYEHPVNEFVADFVGASNILDDSLVRDGGACEIRLADDSAIQVSNQCQTRKEGPVRFSVRPERIEICSGGSDERRALAAEVTGLNYLGGRYLAFLKIAGQPLRAETNHEISGPKIHIRIPSDAVNFFD
jgi:iron(III) transport system ATP-binding protein